MIDHSGKRINILDEYKQKFFQLPMVLFANPIYKDLNNDSKLAYAILSNRLSLSKWTTTNTESKWIDDNGDIFFYYSNSNLAEILNISKRKVSQIKNELKDANLLSVEKQGFNLPQKCYLHYPIIMKEDIQTIDNLLGLDNEKLDPEYSTKQAKRASDKAVEKRTTKKDSKTTLSANSAPKVKDDEINNSTLSANSAPKVKDDEINDSTLSANSAMPDVQNLLPNNTESSKTTIDKNIDTTETDKASSNSNYSVIFNQENSEERSIMTQAFIHRHISNGGYFKKQQLEKILLITKHDFSKAEEFLKTVNKAKKILESRISDNLIISPTDLDIDDKINILLNQITYSVKMNQIEKTLMGFVYTSFYRMFSEFFREIYFNQKESGLISPEEYDVKVIILNEAQEVG